MYTPDQTSSQTSQITQSTHTTHRTHIAPQRRLFWQRLWRNKTTIAFVAFFAILAVASVVIVYNLMNRSLDDRGQAASSNGIVVLTLNQTSPSGIAQTTINTPTVVDFVVDTKNLQTDGVQVVFQIETQTLTSQPEFSLQSGSGLKLDYQNISQNSSGYKVSAILVPETTGQAFSTSEPKTIAQLRFTPTKSGSIRYVFDNGLSKVPIFKSLPVEDQLRDVGMVSTTVTDPAQVETPTDAPESTAEPTATPQATPESTPETTPVPTATPTPNPTATPITQATTQPTATPKPTVAPTAAPIIQATAQPTATPRSNIIVNPTNEYPAQQPTAPLPTAVVITTFQGCSMSCSSHVDCQSGLACVGGVCRNPLCNNAVNCTCPPNQTNGGPATITTTTAIASNTTKNGNSVGTNNVSAGSNAGGTTSQGTSKGNLNGSTESALDGSTAKNDGLTATPQTTPALSIWQKVIKFMKGLFG